MQTVTLSPPASPRVSTHIVIGPGVRQDILSAAGIAARFDRIAVIYDRAVTPVAEDIAKSLPQSMAIPVASGDASKSLAEVERIARSMLDARCTRQTLVVSVGGGMLTDLGGFVASVFMRGVPCVHVPTSLLAMVDASIGGKTGVNLEETKNIIGTVSHPLAVVIDTELLVGLPPAQMAEGLVEVIKIAAVADAGFLEWLEQNIDAVLRKNLEMCEECIARSAGLKARIVERDERDELVRLHLNFGHTVGHAVEACSRFRLSHGKAVSIGMAAEMAMAGSPGAARVTALLERIGMPLALSREFSSGALWGCMQSDKKNVGADVRIAVPNSLGSAQVRTIARADFDRLFA